MEKRNHHISICTTSDISTDYRLHKMATSLKKLNYEVLFIARNKQGYTNTSTDFKVKQLYLLFEKGLFFYIEYNIRLFLYLVMRAPKFIFSVDLDTLPACRLAGIMRKRPIIFDSHEYFPEVPELQHRPLIKKIWLQTEKWCIPGIAYGITVCSPIADLYMALYNKPFSVIRNLPFALPKESKEKRRTQKGFTLLYQGAVNMGRGLKEIITAIKELDDVHLLIVGDGNIFSEIKQLVHENNLDDRVHFTGKIPFKDLKHYTQQADLGLCLMENIGLNYYYSLPNRLFDLIQNQVPILAIGFPEIKKVIETYEVGYCIPDLNSSTLKKTINHIKGNRALQQQWKSNAIEASKDLIWETDAYQLEDIFRKLS